MRSNFTLRDLIMLRVAGEVFLRKLEPSKYKTNLRTAIRRAKKVEDETTNKKIVTLPARRRREDRKIPRRKAA